LDGSVGEIYKMNLLASNQKRVDGIASYAIGGPMRRTSQSEDENVLKEGLASSARAVGRKWTIEGRDEDIPKIVWEC
jgi:hypothetical protein